MHVNWLKVPERIEYEVISTTHTSFFSSLVLIISTTSSPFSYFDPHDLKSLITLLHPPSQSRLNITKSQAALFDMQHLSWNKLPDSCSIFPTLLLYHQARSLVLLLTYLMAFFSAKTYLFSKYFPP